MTEVQTFKQAVLKHAQFMGWDTSENIEDEYAGFSFELEEGGEVDLAFFLNEDRVDISVSGQIVLDAEEDIPDDFSTLLLRRSDDLMYGAWTMAETETEKFQYRLLWTLELDYFAQIDSEKLSTVLDAMMEEASEVDKIWEEGPY